MLNTWLSTCTINLCAICKCNLQIGGWRVGGDELHLLVVVLGTKVSPTTCRGGVCVCVASSSSTFLSWFIYTWVLCDSAPPDSNLLSVPQSPPPTPTSPPQPLKTPTPPFIFSLHPLLHLISLFPSIQIFFIGMTGLVVGDSHRHGGTMHCDGDIHMIMPSVLTRLQIHLDSQSPFLPPPLFSLSALGLVGCIFLCVDFSNGF